MGNLNFRLKEKIKKVARQEMGKELSLEKVAEKTDDEIMAMADKDFKDATAEVKAAIQDRKA